MNAINPYQTPVADVAESPQQQDAFQPVRILSASGRIGRIRFIGNSLALIVGGTQLMFLYMWAVANSSVFETETTSAIKVIAVGFGVLLYAGIVVLWNLLAIQRLHDLNLTGWWIVLTYIPLITYIATPVLLFMFWLVPGSKKANNYGSPPVRNSVGSVALAVSLLVLVLGYFIYLISTR